MSLDAADRVAIHELLSLYGHLIDQQRWDELDQVFTEDMVFDASDFGVQVSTTRAELLAKWSSDQNQHPLAHHCSNVVVTEGDNGTARVMSKGIGVLDSGRVGSVTYEDIVVRTDAGWRMASRRAEFRRPRRAVVDDRQLSRRLATIESRLEISQLPIRYAMAVDSRDVDTWVELFVPDVRVTKETSGRDALRQQIDGMLRTFRRSVHQICGQRIVLDPDDGDRAAGFTYCRAEHEVDDRWVVMAICYFDDYDRVDGEWLFRRRKEKHWYAADINEHPQAVAFDSWHVGGPPPALPDDFRSWHAFWGDAADSVSD